MTLTSSSGDESASRSSAQFATTHWSTVLAAGDSASPGSREALERLCRTYWFPLYAFARRHGHASEVAQDLTQGFLAHLIENQFFARAEPERGKFRSFLLGAFKRFVHDQDRAQLAQRRGGQIQFIPLDSAEAEQRLGAVASDVPDPEDAFEREWAVTVLDEAMKLLEAECRREGKGELFEALHPFLQGDRPEVRQADLAARLDLSIGAVKVAVHRLRRRYGELLRAVVANTVTDPGDVEAELRHLVGLLSL
jgi:RNA polymerase sigma-70 factor (ECF subfamily)